MSRVNFRLRFRRLKPGYCRKCLRPVKKGDPAFRVTHGISSELFLGTVSSYLLHEWCIDPIILIETTFEGWALYIEKDTSFGV